MRLPFRILAFLLLLFLSLLPYTIFSICFASLGSYTTGRLDARRSRRQSACLFSFYFLESKSTLSKREPNSIFWREGKAS